MSFMDTFLSGLKITDEDGYDDGDYLDNEDELSESASPRQASKNEGTSDEQPARKPLNRPGNARSKRLGNGMEVCVIKPTNVDESREIADTLLSNRTVVLNMEGLDGDIAQRIIDFTSGATYAINGNLQKISHYIFIITPPSVDISGDFPTLLNGSFDAP